MPADRQAGRGPPARSALQCLRTAACSAGRPRAEPHTHAPAPRHGTYEDTVPPRGCAPGWGSVEPWEWPRACMQTSPRWLRMAPLSSVVTLGGDLPPPPTLSSHKMT